MTPTAPALALVVALTLGVSACGGSDRPRPDSEAERVVATMTAYFADQANGDLSEADARCFSTRFVAAAGLERLKESRLVSADDEINRTDVDVPPGVARDFARAYFACVDYAAVQAASIAKTDDRVDAAALARCIDARVSRSQAEQLIVNSLAATPDPALSQRSYRTVLACKRSATR